MADFFEHDRTGGMYSYVNLDQVIWGRTTTPSAPRRRALASYCAFPAANSTSWRETEQRRWRERWREMSGFGYRAASSASSEEGLGWTGRGYDRSSGSTGGDHPALMGRRQAEKVSTTI
jgi:hypothetical protein